jgi:hypothetical protein
MKPFPFLIPLAMLAFPLHAAAGQARALESARGHQVTLIDDDRREWQGRLLEVSRDAVTIEIESTARQFSLARVKRVDSDGDSVVDGAVKGALFGGIMALLFANDARAIVGGAMVYGLIGTGADALNRCRHTVYRAPAVTASVKIASW